MVDRDDESGDHEVEEPEESMPDRKTPTAIPESPGWDPDTGVHAKQDLRPQTQPGYAAVRAEAKPPQSASARAAFRAIGELKTQLHNHSVDDRAAMEKLGDKIEETKEKLETKLEETKDKIDDKFAAQAELITGIRVAQEGVKSALETMTAEVRSSRDIRKVEVEAHTTTTVEIQKTNREAMSNRTKVTIAIIGVAATGLGMLLKYLLGLAG